jgi:hypothetical protein
VLALLLRLPGHFYPVPYHYDEGYDLQEPLRYFSGRLHPDNFRHPVLNSYLIFAAETVYYVLGRSVGTFNSPSDFFQAYITDRSGFLSAGRSVSLLVGLLTIFLTYQLGRQLWSVPVGLGGALLLAVSPQHIIISNNLHVWSLGTCIATLALLYLVRLGSATQRQLAVTGIVVGLAIASVYVLGLLLLPLMVALYIRWQGVAVVGTRPKHAVVDIVVVSAGVAVGFALGNFGVLTAWRKVLNALVLRLGLYGSGSATDYLTSAGWYITSVWDEFAMGPLLASLAVVALLWVSWRGSPTQWVVLSFVAAVFLLQPAVLEFHASRYTVPAYPVLLLAVSALILEVWAQLAASKPLLRKIPIPLLVLLLLAAFNLTTVVEYHDAVQRTPTRELARQWVEAHLPPGTKLVMVLKHMSPIIPLGGKSLEQELRLLGRKSPALGNGELRYEVVYLQPHHIEKERWQAVIRDRIAELAAEGTYMIYLDPILPLDRARLQQQGDFIKDLLDAEHPLVTRFFYSDLTRLPDETATVNPEVRIYHLLRDGSVSPTQNGPK